MARKPAYVAIADALRGRIESREYKPGDKLPAERELVSEFDVARMTIRHALDLLQTEGLIDRRRGRTGGTFVRAVPPTLELSSLESFNSQLDRMEIEHSHQVLNTANVSATQRVATALGLEAGDEVFQAEIVRLVAGTPAMIETIFQPTDFAAAAEHPDLNSGEALSVLFGKEIDRREDVITPGVTTETEREKLGVTSSTPLLRIASTTYSEGEVVSFTFLTVLPDAVQIKTVTGN